MLTGSVYDDEYINQGSGFADTFREFVDDGLPIFNSFVDEVSDSYSNARDKVEDVFQSVKKKTLSMRTRESNPLHHFL